MSTVVKININKDLLDEASVWITKLDRTLTSEEVHELKTWLKTSPRHLDIFMELSEMWDKMEALSQLSELFPYNPQRSSDKKVSVFAWAASIVFASLISLGVWFNSDIIWGQGGAQVVQFSNDYETKVGEQSIVYLQDKTKLALNTNSLVKVTFTDKQRVVELLRGEIHVTVAHNPEKPLSVYAGSNIIQAIGTAFNVELSNEKVELIVTDGEVQVSDINALPNGPLALNNVYLPGGSLSLSKGQKAQLKASDTLIMANDKIKLLSDLAWQQGNIIFRGESLAQAMQEVSRYTDYTFDFRDEEIKSLKIAGLFKSSDINGLLASLESNFDVTHEKTSQNSIRLSKKRSNHEG